MNEKQIAELQNSLYFLGEHLHLLNSWIQRGDTHPGLRQQVELTQAQFDDVAKILSPKPKGD